MKYTDQENIQIEYIFTLSRLSFFINEVSDILLKPEVLDLTIKFLDKEHSDYYEPPIKILQNLFSNPDTCTKTVDAIGLDQIMTPLFSLLSKDVHEESKLIVLEAISKFIKYGPEKHRTSFIESDYWNSLSVFCNKGSCELLTKVAVIFSDILLQFDSTQITKFDTNQAFDILIKALKEIKDNSVIYEILNNLKEILEYFGEKSEYVKNFTDMGGFEAVENLQFNYKTKIYEVWIEILTQFGQSDCMDAIVPEEIESTKPDFNF